MEEVVVSSGSIIGQPSSASTGDQAEQTVTAMPLCADLDGRTNALVRADMPAGTYGVHCRVLTDNAQIGVQSVIDQGVIAAVDVFNPADMPGAAGAEICLQGVGSMVFLDAAQMPRVPQPLVSLQRDGYTCATIPGLGTVVLVQNGSNPVEAAPAPAAVQTLNNCRVTTTHMLNLRAEPSTSSTALEMVPYETTLTATAATNGWYEVVYLDMQGWLSADYLLTEGVCR